MSIEKYVPAQNEQQILEGLHNYQLTVGKLNQSASFDEQRNPELSARLGQIYRIAPHLEPGVTLSLAKMNADDALIARVAQAALYQEAVKAQRAAELAKKNQNWFERNIYNKVKTGLRWTTAAAQLPFDLTNEIAGRLLLTPVGDKFKFDPNNPFAKGWFASTQFGTMLQHGDQSGSGFFVGGDAESGRQQRLMEYTGSMPLTIEAGATENTAFQPDPTEVHDLAVRISAEKGVPFDEALKEATQTIRQNARMPVTFATMFPMALGEVTGHKVKYIDFSYNDIGSRGYNTASAIGSIGLMFALPDPSVIAVKKIAKPLIRYARGVSQVDKEGNLIVDFTHAAQNGAEAEFLAKVDGLNIAVNRYEAMGISAQDAAVETLTPQQGVWYHGSTGGMIDNFTDIHDPSMPSASGNLFGPGLYTSESPLITQTGGYQPSNSFQLLTDAEKTVLQNAGFELPRGASRALTPEEIATLHAANIGDLPTQLSTVYRFGEKEGVAARMFDAFVGLTLDEQQPLLDEFVRNSRIAQNFVPQIEKFGFKGIVDEASMSTALQRAAADISSQLGMDGSNNWELLKNAPAKIKAKLTQPLRTIAANIEQNNMEFLKGMEIPNTPVSIAHEIIFKLDNYFNQFKKFPTSYEDFINLFGGEEQLKNFISSPVKLDEYATKRFNFFSAQLPLTNSAKFRMNFFSTINNDDSFLRLFESPEELFGRNLRTTFEFNFSSALMNNFRDTLSSLVKIDGIPIEEVKGTERAFQYFLNKVSEVYDNGLLSNADLVKSYELFDNIRPLVLNQKLSELGYDGITHIGGGGAGGGQFMHRVKIWFDPIKNLDITDPLTGEATPVNQALKSLVDGGNYMEEAGKLRDEMDVLKAEREAGVIPGFGKQLDPEAFKSYFVESRQGRFAADQIWKTASSSSPTKWYEVYKMFNGKLPLQLVDRIANAASKDELVALLNEHAGWTPGLSNLQDFNFSLSRVATNFKQASRVDKLMQGMEDLTGKFWHRNPETTALFIHGSDAQKIQAVQNLEAWLDTGARIDPAKTRLLVQEFGMALSKGDKPDIFEAIRSVGKAIQEKMLAATGDKKVAAQASQLFQREAENALGGGLFNTSAEGLRADNGYAATVGSTVSPGGTHSVDLQEMVHGGPGLLSELVNSPLELPDTMQMRRAVSFIGYFTGAQGLTRAIKKSEIAQHIAEVFDVNLTKVELDRLGELRLPLRGANFAMNKVWKNMKKLQLAYAMRNTMEAQARMYAADKTNLFTHPIDYMQVAMHWQIPDDILLGEAFNPIGWQGLGKAFENTAEEYQQFLGSGYFGRDGRMDLVRSQYRNGTFTVYPKEVKNGSAWAKAGAYELRQLSADPIAKMLAKGASVEEVMTWLYSGSPEAQKALGQIEGLMRNGELFYPKEGGFGPEQGQIIPIEPTKANVEARIKTQQQARLNLKTGGDPNLVEVVNSGTINGAPAFTPKGEPTQELLDYFVENINNPELPRFYKGRGQSAALFKAQKSWFDSATNWFFDTLVGWEYNALDRSPLWRMEYAKQVQRLAPLLSPEAATQLLAQMEERVAHYANIAENSKTLRRVVQRKFNFQDYLGPEVDAEEFKNILSTARGTLKLEDLHIYANATTLDKLEGFLFDAASRNSVTDGARIIAPFGAAMAEVWKKAVPLLAKNPDKIVNPFRVFETLSGQNAPKGLQVNGIMHKDPITGEYMYSVPLSGTVAQLMIKAINLVPGMETRNTGSRFSLEAPVQGLNMAFNFVPGMSPVVGFPVGKLMFGSPKTRDIAQILMPYGQPKSPLDWKEYLPGFASKIISSFQADPKRDALYADTLSDVIRVEAATGKWNLSDQMERTQFFADAEAKARVLTFMRGVGQLIGPASPQVTAQVRTQMGDVYSSYLTAEFHKLQSENYDTAVPRFIAMYGNDAFIYMAGKTRAVVGGVEASSEFAKWELDHADLFDSYSEVAGYFGPKGSNFDWAAWQYQLNTGKRERIMPIPDQVEEAEKTIGLAAYRYWTKLAGPNPNEQVKTVLAAEKARLEKEYPGMVSKASFDVQKFDRQIKLLTEASNDPRLKDNDTAVALRNYLGQREQVVGVLKQAGLGINSAKAAPLRQYLMYYGSTLVDMHPEFARVFDRLLMDEVSQ